MGVCLDVGQCGLGHLGQGVSVEGVVDEVVLLGPMRVWVAPVGRACGHRGPGCLQGRMWGSEDRGGPACAWVAQKAYSGDIRPLARASEDYTAAIRPLPCAPAGYTTYTLCGRNPPSWMGFLGAVVSVCRDVWWGGRFAPDFALVAQGIEHWFPKPCAQVRFLPRAHST